MSELKEKKAVRMLEPFDVYNANEIAGFAPEMADQLIASGMAEPYPPVDVTAKAKRLESPPPPAKPSPATKTAPAEKPAKEK